MELKAYWIKYPPWLIRSVPDPDGNSKPDFQVTEIIRYDDPEWIDLPCELQGFIPFNQLWPNVVEAFKEMSFRYAWSEGYKQNPYLERMYSFRPPMFSSPCLKRVNHKGEVEPFSAFPYVMAMAPSPNFYSRSVVNDRITGYHYKMVKIPYVFPTRKPMFGVMLDTVATVSMYPANRYGDPYGSTRVDFVLSNPWFMQLLLTGGFCDSIPLDTAITGSTIRGEYLKPQEDRVFWIIDDFPPTYDEYMARYKRFWNSFPQGITISVTLWRDDEDGTWSLDRNKSKTKLPEGDVPPDPDPDADPTYIEDPGSDPKDYATVREWTGTQAKHTSLEVDSAGNQYLKVVTTRLNYNAPLSPEQIAWLNSNAYKSGEMDINGCYVITDGNLERLPNSFRVKFE